jgi:hypothetical protein
MPFQFCDIAVNLLDHMFKGSYREKQKHPNDVLTVLNRAKKVGVEKFIITGFFHISVLYNLVSADYCSLLTRLHSLRINCSL